ncbi:MAG: IPT/TIG domain-containing protein [Bacteroidota bacterium]
MLQFRIYLLVLITLTLTNCEKEEPVIIPELEIGVATDIINNTATLQAQILEQGTEEVLEYGFLWKADDSPDLSDPASQKVVLSGKFEEGPISTSITKLEPGTTYYYQAYARTSANSYSSSFASFNTLGPQITGMSPMEGIKGTEVTLTGQYFSNNIDQVTVFVEGEPARVTEASETHITFIMPAMNPGSIAVSISVNEILSDIVDFSYRHSFTLASDKVRVGKILVVRVSNFSRNNTYKVGGVEALQVWDWLTEDYREIGVEVPNDLSLGEAIVEVFDTEGKPLINANETPLTIIPSGIWTQKQDFTYGENYKRVEFVINDAGYIIADKVYVYDPANDTWAVFQEIDFLVNSFFKLDAHTIEEQAYILADTTLWRFDPITKSIEELKSFPGQGQRNIVTFSDGTQLFAGLGYYYDPDTNEKVVAHDFWKYHPMSDTWIQLSDFPASGVNINRNTTGIYLNSQGYLFNEGMWTYNINTDTFAKVDTPLYPDDDGATMFVLNNRLYYGMGNCCDTKIYEYDPVKNTTTEESSFPGYGRWDTFTLVIGDKVYVGAGSSIENKTNFSLQDVWEFVPGR